MTVSGLPPDTSGRLDRRMFLGALVGAFLAGCTSNPEPPSPAASPTTAAPTTAAPSATTPTTAAPSPTLPTVATVDALVPPDVDLPERAFGLGVASGEPDHRSVVLWTRLVGDLPDTFEIVWELADDPEVTQLLATGFVSVDASNGHSVRIIPDNLLADREYFYRFRAGSLTSPVGRTRTLPDATKSRPITIGVSSCQARSDGAWAAHADMASTRLDAVLWLGDYIYGEYRTLEEYRAAYADYRSDPQLQSCHAAHPWFVFTDDHEVANDYDAAVDPARRAAALRAWWENQPTRLAPPDANGTLLTYRSFDLGGAARLIGLETRQFATADSVLGDAQWTFLEAAARHSAANTLVASPTLLSGVRDLSGDPLLPYSIDARPSDRVRMAEALAAMPAPLIVSGDLHTSLVADYAADPLDSSSPRRAPEIMAPAISSAFPERFADLAPFLPIVNPQLRSVEVENGWLELQLADDERTAVFHFVDDIADPASSITFREIDL